MKMSYMLLCLLVVVASFGGPPAVATDNEPPVVDAGLDQSVAVGATVYLDAGGSYDPDGEIRSYEWEIRGPNGSRIAPECPTCERTSFVPGEPGTYTVTVRVTDDDGGTRNDTLYVEARPGTGPSVTLSAPSSTTSGDPASVTTSVDAGTASLDELRWRVNGVRFGTTDIEGDTATVSQTIPTAGDGSLVVRAIVVDDAGLRATANARVDISGSPGDGSGGANDPARGNDSVTNETTPSSNNGTDPERSVSMSVRGPQLLTGERPLRGTYSLSVGDTDAEIRSIGWYVDGALVAGGPSATITFDPGRHDLFARVLTEAESRTVTFSDGTTEVVADPPPSVSFQTLSTDGAVVRGRASASDEFGRLQEFYVTVDGNRIANASVLFVPRSTNRLLGNLPFRRTLSENESYELSVVAVDDRGQSATVTRAVTTGSTSDNRSTSSTDDPNPSVISARFVNDPVDSYHDRIPEDRYLVEHVTRISLDGVDPSSVDVVPVNVDGYLKSFPARTEKRYDDSDDILVVRSYFAAQQPGEYQVNMRLVGDEKTSEQFRSRFTVTPSKPVPRLKVTRAGTGPDVQNWGMVVDASGSFDPDGTHLEYEWNGDVREINSGSLAKLDSLGRASLTISGQDGLSTTIPGGFLDYYNPGINKIEVTSTDIVSNTDRVYFRISTPVYAFTKQTYDVDLSVAVVGDGRVVEWKNVERSPSESSREAIGSPEDNLEQWYTGLVAIDRDEFSGGSSPKIRIYNDAEPETTAITYPVTGSNIERSGSVSRRDVTIESVRYEVKTEGKRTYVTSSPDEKEKYVQDGYEVIDTRREPVEYVVETGIQTWEKSTERRSFDSADARSRFLRNSPDDWRRAGTEVVSERRLTTETVWRESRGGYGTFTGRTKQVVPTYAERRTEFEYREQVTETVEISDKGTIMLPSGETVEVVETREQTVTRYRTYWALAPKSPEHEPTGETRQVIADAAYETRYEYEIETYETVDVTRYVVERTVSEPEMVWTDTRTVEAHENVVQRARTREDFRITNTKLQTEWVLEGTESRTTIKDEYRRSDDVNRTIVYVSGTVVTGGSNDATSAFRERLTFEGVLTEAEVRERLAGSEGDDVCDEDDPLTTGCGVDA